MKSALAGWGRHPIVQGTERFSEDLATATKNARLSRGLGRSYGDASLPVSDDDVLATPHADRLLSFDESTRILRAEAGLSLLQINELFLPRRFFVPVTPGTKFVTLGGMVASDVHGKNHHVAGCFGEHVTSLKMRVADGRVVDCSPTENADLFAATIGGMGLTGHILEVEFKMDAIPSPWIWNESLRVRSLDEFLDGLSGAARDFPMTMGWIDCVTTGKEMGRGTLHAGRWATADEAPSHAPPPLRKKSVPFLLPDLAMNKLGVWLVNNLLYHKQPRKKVTHVVHPDVFFYPLDAIHNWNRLYGPSGFTQYQCVLPKESARQGAHAVMQSVTRSGLASPLCVIKDCGAEGRGLLSFPLPGISIALDFPMRARTQALVDELSRIVIDHGGRIYLTKDALTRREDFSRMEPRLAKFEAVRRKWDPDGRFRSLLSQRLLG